MLRKLHTGQDVVIKYNIVVERKGFEPSIHFWRIHAFQACALNHSATSLFKKNQNYLIMCYILKIFLEFSVVNLAISSSLIPYSSDNLHNTYLI